MVLLGLRLYQGFTVSYLDYKAPTKILLFIYACSVTQSCLTLCDPTDYSLLDSPVRGIFQARILSELPFPAPGDLPDSRIKPASGGLSL